MAFWGAGQQPAMPRCQVAGCRHPDTHVTAGHRCGVCGRHGHGEAEHGDVAARLALRAHAADVVASPCRVPGCPHPTHHTTAGHRCARCREPGHRAEACPKSPLSAPAPDCRGVACPACRQPAAGFRRTFVTGECCVCLEPAAPNLLVSGCGHALCGGCGARCARGVG